MKPRTDAELIAYYRETYPQEHAFNGSVDAAIRRDKIVGPPTRLIDEKSTDGRLIYPEMQGLMRNAQDHNRHD